VLALSYWNNASALNEDLKSMTLYVSDHAQPGDMIVLQNHAQTAAVNYYLDRDVHQVAVWPELGVRQRFVEASDLSVPTKPIDPPPHLWVVFDYQSAPTIDFTHLVLERYHYTLLHTRRFAGVSVLLYGR
jgi:hypothetical protein